MHTSSIAVSRESDLPFLVPFLAPKDYETKLNYASTLPDVTLYIFFSSSMQVSGSQQNPNKLIRHYKHRFK